MQLKVKDLYKDMPNKACVVTVMKEGNHILVLRSSDPFWKKQDAVLAEFESEKKAEEFALKLCKDLQDLEDPFYDRGIYEGDQAGAHSSSRSFV